MMASGCDGGSGTALVDAIHSIEKAGVAGKGTPTSSTEGSGPGCVRALRPVQQGIKNREVDDWSL